MRSRRNSVPLALILSSHVAGSRVGGGAQALALAQRGVDPVHVPTVLFGRHPGWGAPGGAATPDVIFEGMLEGVEANGLFALTDVVVSGYFASAVQVQAAARAIDAVRAAGPGRILVDPTMGDGRLYVQPEVAEAVAALLVPRADLLAPNAWELSHLTGAAIDAPADAVAAARTLGKPVVVSSVPLPGEIGVVYADAEQAWLVAHPPSAEAPKGTGDLLTALLAAGLIDGLAPEAMLVQATGGVAETVAAARDWAAPELPIVAMGARLGEGSSRVRLERLA